MVMQVPFFQFSEGRALYKAEKASIMFIVEIYAKKVQLKVVQVEK